MPTGRELTALLRSLKGDELPPQRRGVQYVYRFEDLEPGDRITRWVEPGEIQYRVHVQMASALAKWKAKAPEIRIILQRWHTVSLGGRVTVFRVK